MSRRVVSCRVVSHDVVACGEVCRSVIVAAGGLHLIRDAMDAHATVETVVATCYGVLWSVSTIPETHAAIVELGLVERVVLGMARASSSLPMQEFGCGALANISMTQTFAVGDNDGSGDESVRPLVLSPRRTWWK